MQQLLTTPNSINRIYLGQLEVSHSDVQLNVICVNGLLPTVVRALNL